MPSINHYVPVHADRRIRINTCEGEVAIANEVRMNGGWYPSRDHSVVLNREQAEQVAKTILSAMAKNF